ncbi:hypothetical protein A2334_06000 [Candidatus Roizmanbacteria bacterium RIFOXYB2_FULL_38_10]|uniref:Uncharacterized protein n=1 Tax=Candidatus Roizmanbacteria bacterium RIFOXYD1_FULL_38_12 TaxID=1802093 RepID=A0A1F7L1T4_9BACT|nr:MAG: hypothetical protein A3K47_05000 [Candidatus Roizmanbacteria bacterium RIFOXYA2_FULL_38_14]OGK64107.1 MAG: hypothetical protein A3K27_05000 [Candidatus Roizmanbacteria bacterium RIFOXYA1_FULL_37_12]OGK65953.1 MAG: hypothetical protein A3K38_05000 [Candidatus Roizmanbacteria bacterium RIFOXYB1_FULL_40_23]OGK68401.1 MAG: hypothetical protein A2334_06000 [Candidatus Roizmanbacteria bacterium RIFOXYB2_FULL_38_10]OGK70358.1 MAG: hypothetical protein A3K21_05005 [Candidatus Roizmanbacteria ba
MKTKRNKRAIKKLLHLFYKNYIVGIFILCILSVGLVSLYKLFVTKPTYIYARVKLGQGMWWASTAKAPVWFVKAIKNNVLEKDIIGKPVAEILSVRYYPWGSINGITNQFDVYITTRLKVTSMGRSGSYSFKRSPISVGMPIELDLSSSFISGTVTQIDTVPFREVYEHKTVTLEKKYAHPWEYESIRVGDTYFDGTDAVFKITEKAVGDDTQAFAVEQGRFIDPSVSSQRISITVKAKVMVEQKDGNLIFAQEQTLIPGKYLTITTPHYSFYDFVIKGIE